MKASKKSTNKTKSVRTRTENPTSLDPTQFKKLEDQLLIIDVRGWLEYMIGHIPGAHRFSRAHILRNIPKDQAIALTCLSGHRSAIAAQWLVSQGYRQVYNLNGGILAWQQMGYTIQRGLTQ